MATKVLTPRQQEIRDLQQQGMKPAQIAKKLKISTNAIYQQIRRMRESGAKPAAKPAAAKPATPAPPADPTPQPQHQTPLQALTVRERELKDEIGAAEREAAQAAKAAEQAKDRAAKIGQRLGEELKRVDDAMLVLRGNATAHAKPAKGKGKAATAPAASTSGNGGDPAAGKPAEETPAAA